MYYRLKYVKQTKNIKREEGGRWKDGWIGGWVVKEGEDWMDGVGGGIM